MNNRLRTRIRYVISILASSLFALLIQSGQGRAATPLDITWNPSAIGLSTQGPFTFDTVTLSTHLTSILATDTNSSAILGIMYGYVQMTNFLNDGVVVQTPTVAGSPYTLYWDLIGDGPALALQTPAFPPAFTRLDLYGLRAAPGIVTFGFSDSSPQIIACSSPGSCIASTLGTASLIAPAPVSIINNPGGGGASVRIEGDLLFLPNQVRFQPNPDFSAFFANPPATTALIAHLVLTATSDELVDVGTAIRPQALVSGEGTLTFSLAVPEPQSYALLLAGLPLIGFLAARRTNTRPPA